MFEPKQFYLRRNDKAVGPLTGIQLREEAFAGAVTPDTLVRVGQAGEWVPAKRLSNLFGADGKPLPHPPETQALLDKERREAADEWYVRQGVKVLGPFSSTQLRAKAGSGEITPETRIMKGAQGTWVPAGRVKRLFGLDPAEIEAIAAEVLLAPTLLEEPTEEESRH